MNPDFDDTQPNPAIVTPHMIRMDEDEASGPGCLIWGVVGVFMLVLSVGAVLMAALAGWNDGYRVATGNATATSVQELQVQCDSIPGDLANGAFGLAQRRVDTLLLTTPAAPCLATLAPQMTSVYASAMQTLTPAATATTELVPTMPSETPVIVLTAAPTSSSGFDLAALLTEAQTDISLSQNMTAIDTLDAISAIDPTYQKPLIDQLIFSALTNEARNLFSSGANLAQAITLVNRAENYGDIGELNYERFIADLWLQAQAYSGVNYPRAIQLLGRIVYEQNLPNYRNAQVELFNQYVAYGSTLLATGDPCTARSQFDTALTMYTSGDVAGKRAAADAACSAVPLTGTLDPLAPTPDPASSGGSSGGSGIGERP